MFGRKKESGGVLMGRAADCDLCGTTVSIDQDGRCRLGHWVALPSGGDFLPVEAPAETGQAVPPASAAAETPPPPAAAPEARPTPAQPDPFFHPYDEILAADRAPGQPPPLPQPPEAAPDELDDLLGWNDR